MEVMEATRSRSSKFVERWAKAEEINVKLGLIAGFLTFMCIVLTIALVYIAVKPRPIFFIPAAWEAGVAFPQSSSKATVPTFVSSWILNWCNFTPATVEAVYTRAQKFMSPRLLSRNGVRLKKDIEHVKYNNISSLFSIVDEPVVNSEKKGFHVQIKGEKGIYVGKEEIKVQKTIFKVLVRSVPPTDWNPYGLLIEEIDQEVAQ